MERNGKLLHLFIPSKTATLVPEFAVEDLHLGRTAALVPGIAVKLFRRRYRTEASTGTTITGLVNKLQGIGIVCDEKRSGVPSMSQETVETIRQAIKQSPKASTRRLSREHSIPKSTVWQTLRFVLKKKAYHIHHLELEDDVTRMAT